MLLLKFWYIIISIRVAVYINHAIVFWIYLFCGIDFVFSGLGFSGTTKGKLEKPRCHFIFVIELPVRPGEPISNRIWTHGESTQDPKQEQTIDCEKLVAYILTQYNFSR